MLLTLLLTPASTPVPTPPFLRHPRSVMDTRHHLHPPLPPLSRSRCPSPPGTCQARAPALKETWTGAQQLEAPRRVQTPPPWRTCSGWLHCSSSSVGSPEEPRLYLELLEECRIEGTGIEEGFWDVRMQWRPC